MVLYQVYVLLIFSGYVWEYAGRSGRKPAVVNIISASNAVQGKGRYKIWEKLLYG